MMINKEKFLKDRGWSTWYNPNYWVHPESVINPKAQDYTNYGMNIDDAIAYEKLGKPKHREFPLPIMSQIEMAQATEGLTKERKDANS
jgi:hypothetical protein